jgi:hypothetical protein
MTDLTIDCPQQIASEIIERIWNVWYGDHRGDMPPDRFATTLEVAKGEIIAALNVLCEKSTAEMLRVKMCEHIAEGEEGWNQPECRNVCPSTMAVAKLRDAFEMLISCAEACATVYKHGELMHDVERAKKALSCEYRDNEK